MLPLHHGVNERRFYCAPAVLEATNRTNILEKQSANDTRPARQSRLSGNSLRSVSAKIESLQWIELFCCATQQSGEEARCGDLRTAWCNGASYEDLALLTTAKGQRSQLNSPSPPDPVTRASMLHLRKSKSVIDQARSWTCIGYLPMKIYCRHDNRNFLLERNQNGCVRLRLKVLPRNLRVKITGKSSLSEIIVSETPRPKSDEYSRFLRKSVCRTLDVGSGERVDEPEYGESSASGLRPSVRGSGWLGNR